jgi:hypothetical protein
LLCRALGFAQYSDFDKHAVLPIPGKLLNAMMTRHIMCKNEHCVLLRLTAFRGWLRSHALSQFKPFFFLLRLTCSFTTYLLQLYSTLSVLCLPKVRYKRHPRIAYTLRFQCTCVSTLFFIVRVGD